MVKIRVFLSSVFIMAAAPSFAADDRAVKEVLDRADACSVPLSTMKRRLNDVMSAAEQKSAAAEIESWGCYDSQPGHPTPDEKIAYVERVSRYAVEAEQKYKVPASVIAAMAIIESGYGFTRTAQYANNLFGWKEYSSRGKRYVLACQDTRADPNRCYKMFESEQDAIDFVASRLASGFTRNYAAANKMYLKDTSANVPVIERTQNWIAVIANPYNGKPVRYARDVCRLMRDPVSPSETLNETRNLYKLSLTDGQKVTYDGVRTRNLLCSSIKDPPFPLKD